MRLSNILDAALAEHIGRQLLPGRWVMALLFRYCMGLMWIGAAM
jgi:hypothetical protein